MPRQRPFDLGNVEFSPRRNATIYGQIFGVDGSEPFGPFDLEAMHSALSKSVLFTPDSEETTIVSVPDTVRWRNRMMKAVPISVPDNYSIRYSYPPTQSWLTKILQLRHAAAQKCPIIRVSLRLLTIVLTTDSYMSYYQTPSLQVPTNDCLLLLLWSHHFFGNTLRALSDWAQSKDGRDFTQLLVGEVLKQQPAAQLALTLAAFLSFERL